MTRTLGTTHSSMAEFNRSRIIQILHHQGTCSRAQLARALHLTPAAISKITASLIDAQIIQETGAIDGLMQRRSIGLTLNEHAWHVIGIKIARSNVIIAVFDVQGSVKQTFSIDEVSTSTIHEVVQRIHQTITTLLEQDPSIKAIGIAVPGPYLRNEGRIALAETLQGWQHINFQEEFAHAFPVPTIIEHDARAGVVAQALYGDVPTDHLAYYLLGDGIGLGVISDDTVLHGSLGTSTEIGHVSIDVHGNPCECGNFGCLETYCSAIALHQSMISHQQHFISTYHIDPALLTHTQACTWLIQHDSVGDDIISALLDGAYEAIAYGCVTILNTFNPATLILGDILAQGGNHLLATITRICQQRVLPQIWQSTRIMCSTLPTDATLLGSGAIATRELLAHPSKLS